MWQRVAILGVAIFLMPSALAQSRRAIDPHRTITISYERPRSIELLPAFERISKSDLLESWIRPVSGSLVLPQDIPVWVGECENATPRSPDSLPRISLCLELVKEVEELVSYYLSTEPNREARTLRDSFINGTVVYFMYTGLAKRLFVDLNLPIVVSEDAAADQLATLFFLDEGKEGPPMLQGVIGYLWTLANIQRSTKSDSGTSLAQKRLLAEQKMFDVMCMLVGSNPDAYVSSVKSKEFSQERLARCPREYARVKKAFMELLGPHRR